MFDGSKDGRGVAAPSRAAAPSREQVLADLRRRIGGTGTAGSIGMAGSIGVAGASGIAGTGSGSGLTPRAGIRPPRDRGAPSVSGREILPVLEPLARILPHGGLPRGGVVAVQGGNRPAGRAAGWWQDAGAGGASSLLLSLLAVPTAPGPAGGTPRWTALVGVPDLGLVAAAELGADLDRMVVIPDPGSDVLHVVSVLSDGVEVIVAGEPRGGSWGTPARLRVLAGRLRQHGTVLLVAGRWPGADLVLRARHTGWAGIGQGSGRLRERELTVEVGGRRAGRPGAEYTVRLAGHRDGSVGLLEPAVPGIPSVPAAVPEAI